MLHCGVGGQNKKKNCLKNITQNKISHSYYYYILLNQVPFGCGYIQKRDIIGLSFHHCGANFISFNFYSTFIYVGFAC